MKKILLLILGGVLLLGVILCIYNQGKTELISDKVIDNLSETKKIVLQSGNDKEIIKTITDEKEIEEFISMISQADKENGWVTLEGNSRYILMYDEDNQIIYTILGWDSGHIGFERKEYIIKSEDKERFLQLMDY